ncbi:regulatory protein RecX [Corynebacterium sp. H128]|uniref:regulatory protein RecX n=1 Tax=Corynebacterium sp. H128 TaxID=3133427 RepID=UPI003099BD9F
MADLGAEPLFDAEYEKNKARVRNRALLLLDQRARSIHELRQRLLAAEFEPALVSDVVADLVRCDLLNDEVFAAEWVRQRHHARGKSRRALELELIAKGIAPELREQALESIDHEDESRMARDLALKKVRAIRTVPNDRKEYDKLLRRVVGQLARRGYGESMSFSIAKQVLDERIQELR